MKWTDFHVIMLSPQRYHSQVKEYPWLYYRLSQKTIRFAIGTIPLIIGGLIYIVFRTERLLMFEWFDTLGLTGIVEYLRTNLQVSSTVLPNWAVYSLPDALWLFSFNYLLLVLWEFTLTKQSFFWLSLSSVIGLFSEIGQLIGVFSGTYDNTDLCFMFFASAVSFLLPPNMNLIKF